MGDVGAHFHKTLLDILRAERLFYVPLNVLSFTVTAEDRNTSSVCRLQVLMT
jgi:hypothetical protein